MKISLRTIADFIRHGDRVEGAIDPETGEEFKRPGAALKLAAWLAKTPWAVRQIVKWSGIAGSALAAWLAAHGGGDHTEPMVAGAVAGMLMLSELVTSWLCAKAKIDPPKRTASPFMLAATPAIDRPSIFNAPATPIVPRKLPRMATEDGERFALAESAFPVDAPPTMPDNQKPVTGFVSATRQPAVLPKRAILGEKGQEVQARLLADKSPAVTEGGKSRKIVYEGTLIGELDDYVVIDDLEDGPVALQREDFKFFVAV